MGTGHEAEVAGLYDRVAESYGAIGPPVLDWAGRKLVELAGIRPGQLVLDVGCGRGAALFPAAEQAGAAGGVVGIDLASGMVRATARDIAARGLANAAVARMDAESLAFGDARFDHVLCAFTIFWLDLDQALAEFLRVLRSGGLLALSISGGVDPRWAWYNELLLAYQRDHDVPLGPQAATRAWQRSELPAFLHQAGFKRVSVEVEADEVVYADADEWWQSKWTHGARFPLENMSAALLAGFKAEALARLAPLAQPDGFHERFRMQCITAAKP